MNVDINYPTVKLNDLVKQAMSGDDVLLDDARTTVAKIASIHPQPSELTDAEFEALADQLADDFTACIGSNAPQLSEYAVSREGIYEVHP